MFMFSDNPVSKKGYTEKCKVLFYCSGFQQIKCIPPENLVHSGYFEYGKFSDDQIKTEIDMWIGSDIFVYLESASSAIFACLFVCCLGCWLLSSLLSFPLCIGDNSKGQSYCMCTHGLK